MINNSEDNNDDQLDYDLDQKGIYYIISIPNFSEISFNSRSISALNPIFFRIFHSNSEENGIPSLVFLEYREEMPVSLFIDFFSKNIININKNQITIVYPLSDAENNEIKDKSTIYFYGGPKNVASALNSIVTTILPKMKVTEIPNHGSPIIFKVIPRSLEVFDRLYRLIPAITFEDNTHYCATWSDHNLPIIFMQDDVINSVDMFRSIFSGVFDNMIDVVHNKNTNLNSFFVLFKDNQSALTAITKNNYGKIGNKELLITHFFDKKTMDQMVKWRIKVKKNSRMDQLADFFHYYSKYGVVHSVYIEKNSIVSVQYVHLKDALNAFSQIKSIVLPPLFVGLYIYEIPVNTKESDLYEKLPNAKLIKICPNNNDFRPFASVFFSTVEERDAAQNSLCHEFMDGLRLQVSPQEIDFHEISENLKTKTSFMEESETTVFFPTIPPFTKREDIIQACKIFGDIESCRTISPKNPKQAIVVFANEDSYTKAIENGIKIKKLLIRVKKYNPDMKNQGNNNQNSNNKNKKPSRDVVFDSDS